MIKNIKEFFSAKREDLNNHVACVYYIVSISDVVTSKKERTRLVRNFAFPFTSDKKLEGVEKHKKLMRAVHNGNNFEIWSRGISILVGGAFFSLFFSPSEEAIGGYLLISSLYLYVFSKRVYLKAKTKCMNHLAERYPELWSCPIDTIGFHGYNYIYGVRKIKEHNFGIIDPFLDYTIKSSIKNESDIINKSKGILVELVSIAHGENSSKVKTPYVDELYEKIDNVYRIKYLDIDEL